MGTVVTVLLLPNGKHDRAIHALAFDRQQNALPDARRVDQNARGFAGTVLLFVGQKRQVGVVGVQVASAIANSVDLGGRVENVAFRVVGRQSSGSTSRFQTGGDCQHRRCHPHPSSTFWLKSASFTTGFDLMKRPLASRWGSPFADGLTTCPLHTTPLKK